MTQVSSLVKAAGGPRSPNKKPKNVGSNSPIKGDNKSEDASLDMLCPICEDACSCAGQTVLTITAKRPTQKKRKLNRRTSSSSPLTKKSRVNTSQSHTQSITKTMRMDTKKSSLKSTTSGHSRATSPAQRKHEINASPAIYETTTCTTTAASNSKGREKKVVIMTEDLDAQMALSEYYFSSNGEDYDASTSDSEVVTFRDLAILEAEEDDILADYYGYSSGSEITLDSLFLQSTSCDDSEDHDEMEDEFSLSSQGEEFEDALLGGAVGQEKESESGEEEEEKTAEELLAEQLVKITPQILAAISVATKSMNKSHFATKRSNSFHYECSTADSMNVNNSYYFYPPRSSSTSAAASVADTSLRLEEVLDTKKLSALLSTSPSNHVQSTEPPTLKKFVPVDAFRRARRNSLQNIHSQIHHTTALRQNSLNCTLAAAPEITLSFPPHFSMEYNDDSSSTATTADLQIEYTLVADDESIDDGETACFEIGFENVNSSTSTAATWWSTPFLL